MVYTATQVAFESKVSLSTYYRHLDAGKVVQPDVRAGKRMMYSEERKQDVMAYFAKVIAAR